MRNDSQKRDNWGVQIKPNNIVLFGLDLKDWEGEKLKRKLENYFLRVLGLNVPVKSAKKLKSILCMIELKHMEDKIEILKHRYFLQTYQNNAYIYGDRAFRERIIIDSLAQKAEEELAKGKPIRIQYMRLYVDKVPWVWDNNKQMLVKVI